MSDPARESETMDAIARARTEVETCLAGLVPDADAWPARLHQAQRHALLSPGKRFRPLLMVFLTDGASPIDRRAEAVEIGCVVEMIHAASLILDDLPCMDDADLRRSQPTTHIAYGESTAILSATALLNRAFGIIARNRVLNAEQRIELCDLLSHAVGSTGLIAGQMADLDNHGEASVAEVERVNRLKTGALFEFTSAAAAVIADSHAAQRSALMDFATQLGLAFQLLDDMKDFLMPALESGKSAHRDEGKSTLLTMESLADARRRLTGYLDDAKAALDRADLSTAPILAKVIDDQFSFLRAI